VAEHVRFLNPPTISKPPGYTQVVEVTAPGRLVYIAGQLGLDAQGNLVGGPGDPRGPGPRLRRGVRCRPLHRERDPLGAVA